MLRHHLWVWKEGNREGGERFPPGGGRGGQGIIWSDLGDLAPPQSKSGLP